MKDYITLQRIAVYRNDRPYQLEPLLVSVQDIAAVSVSHDGVTIIVLVQRSFEVLESYDEVMGLIHGKIRVY